MRSYLDIPYVENATGMQLMDIHLPEKEQFDTLIWLHGGGLETGSRKDKDYPQAVTAAGYAFVSVEYRMYPDAQFPDYLHDAANAIACTLKKMPELGGTDRIFLMGESAGAYMTMMLLMDPQYLAAAGVRQDQITGFISDSAQQFCHFRVLKEMGMDSRLERINDRAPIYFIREGLKLQPLLLMYYENDMKCRPEETRLIYANLKNILPEAHVEIAELPGGHCSRPKAEDGSHRMLNRAFAFMQSL